MDDEKPDLAAFNIPSKTLFDNSTESLFHYPGVCRGMLDRENGITIHEWFDYDPNTSEVQMRTILDTIFECLLKTRSEKVLVISNKARGAFSPDIQKFIKDVQFPRFYKHTRLKYIAVLVDQIDQKDIYAQLWQDRLAANPYFIQSNFSSLPDAVQWLNSCGKDIKGNQSVDYDIAEISAFPILQQCLDLWEQAKDGARLPSRITPENIPVEAFPYVMVLAWDSALQQETIKLAGFYIENNHPGGLKGKTLDCFFELSYAQVIRQYFVKSAVTRAPDLSYRKYINVMGDEFEYVRLICPLSSDGVSVTGFFKAIEPTTFRKSRKR